MSTIHALALRILRFANLLATLYPDFPTVVDNWERDQVYESELANTIGCTATRAAEIRLAHDAAWQTLNPQSLVFNYSKWHVYFLWLTGLLTITTSIAYNRIKKRSMGNI